MSAAITLAVMGVALVMVGQARDALDRGTTGLDSAQRLRAGLLVVARDLRMAGAGPETDASRASLPHALPAIELLSPAASAAGKTGRFGAVRITGAPASAAHGRLAARTVPGGFIALRAPPACPDTGACGFREGMSAVVYDGSGAFDRVMVTGVDLANEVILVSPALSREYDADAMVTEVIVSTFGVDVAADGSGRLMRHTAAGAVQPVMDHVVDFAVMPFGDAVPPEPGLALKSPPTYGPTPPPPEVDDPRDAWPAGENCTMARDAAGLPIARMAALGREGQLVAVGPPQVMDGPWCPGASGQPYDADIFRLRRLDVRLRVEAASARFRGPASVMFSRGGHAQPALWVPDLELRLSVSPPNLGRR